MATERVSTGLTLERAIELGAADGQFFGEFWFPRTFSLAPAIFHPRVWEIMEDVDNPYVGMEIFRDGAKTTITRTYLAKRIAYAISNTVLVVSETRGHASRTVDWITNAIKYNKRFSTAFGLEIGDTANKYEVEIVNRLYGTKMVVMAQGMTGQIRGLNIRDNRPDFIICDDPCNEENSGTPELREKLAELFFGALYNSLIAPSLNEHSKLVLLQTCLADGDLISLCHDSELFTTEKFPVFTPDGHSAWPAKWNREELLRQKRDFQHRNMLSTWMREKECRLVSDETASFRREWLRYYEAIPENLATVISIDPVPPPSKKQVREGMRHKDNEVFSVLGQSGGDMFLLEQAAKKGHEPDWTARTAVELIARWKPKAIFVEDVGYQRTLSSLLRKVFRDKGIFVPVVEVSSRQNKEYRIKDTISRYAADGRFFVHRSNMDFVQEFLSHPDVKHDDFLDSVSIGLKGLDENGIFASQEDILEDERKNYPPLKPAAGAP